MSTESQIAVPSVVELNCEDREGRVRVILPDSHIMVMPVEAAVQACRAFKDQYLFRDQFGQLLEHLADWISRKALTIESTYLTVRDAGLLFLVVRKERKYDAAFEDQITDLDIEIANDSDFNLIRLDVLALPHRSDESVCSFLTTGMTFKYKMHGERV